MAVGTPLLTSLLRQFQTLGETQISIDDWESLRDSDDADWSMTITLVIVAIRSLWTSFEYELSESEKARYQSVFPDAIDLARELDISDCRI